jgi:excisionase family DNA binding protein
MVLAKEVPEKLVYDVVEAGRLLGLGRSASYEAARSGQLPTIKIGGRYKVPKAARSDSWKVLGSKLGGKITPAIKDIPR